MGLIASVDSICKTSDTPFADKVFGLNNSLPPIRQNFNDNNWIMKYDWHKP